MNKTRFPHYWICQACAKEQGAEIPEGGIRGATGIDGTCEYCAGGQQKMGEMLLPWVDYDWPKEYKVNRAAKLLRD